MKTARNTLSLLLLSLTSAHGALVAGQSIGLDLGTIAPTNHFNALEPAQVFPSLVISGLVDLTGTPISGVTVKCSNFGNLGAASGPTEAISPFNDSNTQDWMGSQGAVTIVISGLDDALTYDVSIIGHADTWAAGTFYSIDGVNSSTITAGSTNSADTLRVFNDVSISGGTLTIMSDTPQVSWGGYFSALVIEAQSAVPEPGSILLSGIAGIGAMVRRRRLA